MPAEPSSPFRISCPGPVMDRLQGWSNRARQLGLLEKFTAALRYLVDKLMRDPAGWGEPEYHTLGRKLLVYVGSHSFFHVRYAVDEENRVVFVTQINLMPESPLEGAPER